MPSALETAVAHFGARLARRERAATEAMTRAYADAWTRVRAEAEALATSAARGGAGQAELAIMARRRTDFARLIEAELRHFADAADPALAQLVRAAAATGIDDAAALAGVAAGRGAPGVTAMMRRPNRRAIEAMVGATSDGSPLAALMVELTAGTAGTPQRMVDSLASGVAQGLNPRIIAQGLRDEFGTPLFRALLVARTETQRAYRTATMETYRANDDIIDGWVWMCACQPTTCAACWAMHGSMHSLGETLEEHPGGACKAAPRVRGVDVHITPGTERLAAETESVQRRVLGAARFAAYQDGALQLDDVVGRRNNAAWGASITVRPLADVVGADAAAGYIGAAREAGIEAAHTA